MADELRARLFSVIHSLALGDGATIDIVSDQPDLLTLNCVIAAATGSGRAKASREEIAATAIRFLEEAADSLEQDPNSNVLPNKAKAARAALSLKPELVGDPYKAVKGRKGRQKLVADWLDVKQETVGNVRQDASSPLSDLTWRVSQHLARREIDHDIEVRRLAQRAKRPPLESAMRVEWLGRFELYFKIWAPLSGLRHDLEMALHHDRQGDGIERDWFTRKSLFYYAVFLVELDQFVTQHGGLWIFPDTRTEDAIADAMWYVRRPVPLTEVDESTMRIGLSRTPEMAPFLQEGLTHDDLAPLASRWTKWIGTCKCRYLKRPRRDCNVHATIGWARFYMNAVEAQWDFLADWYDLPRPGTTVDPLEHARRGQVVFPPQLPVDKNMQSE
jgi:hypothetical protein